MTSMLDMIFALGLRVLEVMFFAGLIGCAITVIMSWISILRDGLAKDDESTTLR